MAGRDNRIAKLLCRRTETETETMPTSLYYKDKGKAGLKLCWSDGWF